MNKQRPKAYPMQRSSKPGGWRSKAPAANERDRVGSYTFSAIDLPLERGTLERRGVTTTGVAADLPGARVIRRQ